MARLVKVGVVVGVGVVLRSYRLLGGVGHTLSRLDGSTAGGKSYRVGSGQSSRARIVARAVIFIRLALGLGLGLGLDLC